MYIESLIIIYGLCFGSFLNVCIYRIPLKKSFIYCRSACVSCGQKIRWIDNIPLLSFIFLKGRCRDCKSKISLRYPFVELLSAISAIIIYKKTGISYDLFIGYLFVSLLIIVSFIDYNHGIIPNIISIPGIPIFIGLSLLTDRISLLNSIIGSITGFSILFLIFALYYILTKKEGMGIGDVKLIAMIGAFSGPDGVIFSIFLSSLIGTVFGFSMIVFSKKGFKSTIPFGPFLSIAAFIHLLYGQEIIKWYFDLIL